MTEDEVLAFVSGTVASLWALELLLLIHRQPERGWQIGELVRELRASTQVVRQALGTLAARGLVAPDDAGLFCYRPASPQLESFVLEAGKLYAAKPLAVINAIAAAPNEKLRIFADAFRLKE